MGENALLGVSTRAGVFAIFVLKSKVYLANGGSHEDKANCFVFV